MKKRSTEKGANAKHSTKARLGKSRLWVWQRENGELQRVYLLQAEVQIDGGGAADRRQGGVQEVHGRWDSHDGGAAAAVLGGGPKRRRCHHLWCWADPGAGSPQEASCYQVRQDHSHPWWFSPFSVFNWSQWPHWVSGWWAVFGCLENWGKERKKRFESLYALFLVTKGEKMGRPFSMKLRVV